MRWSDPWSDPEIEDFGPWNDAFTDAMRPVYEALGRIETCADVRELTRLMADSVKAA